MISSCAVSSGSNKSVAELANNAVQSFVDTCTSISTQHKTNFKFNTKNVVKGSKVLIRKSVYTDDFPYFPIRPTTMDAFASSSVDVDDNRSIEMDVYMVGKVVSHPEYKTFSCIAGSASIDATVAVRLESDQLSNYFNIPTSDNSLRVPIHELYHINEIDMTKSSSSYSMLQLGMQLLVSSKDSPHLDSITYISCILEQIEYDKDGTCNNIDNASIKYLVFSIICNSANVINSKRFMLPLNKVLLIAASDSSSTFFPMCLIATSHVLLRGPDQLDTIDVSQYEVDDFEVINEVTLVEAFQDVELKSNSSKKVSFLWCNSILVAMQQNVSFCQIVSDIQDIISHLANKASGILVDISRINGLIMDSSDEIVIPAITIDNRELIHAAEVCSKFPLSHDYACLKSSSIKIAVDAAMDFFRGTCDLLFIYICMFEILHSCLPCLQSVDQVKVTGDASKRDFVLHMREQLLQSLEYFVKEILTVKLIAVVDCFPIPFTVSVDIWCTAVCSVLDIKDAMIILCSSNKVGNEEVISCIDSAIIMLTDAIVSSNERLLEAVGSLVHCYFMDNVMKQDWNSNSMIYRGKRISRGVKASLLLCRACFASMYTLCYHHQYQVACNNCIQLSVIVLSIVLNTYDGIHTLSKVRYSQWLNDIRYCTAVTMINLRKYIVTCNTSNKCLWYDAMKEASAACVGMKVRAKVDAEFHGNSYYNSSSSNSSDITCQYLQDIQLLLLRALLTIYIVGERDAVLLLSLLNDASRSINTSSEITVSDLYDYVAGFDFSELSASSSSTSISLEDITVVEGISVKSGIMKHANILGSNDIKQLMRKKYEVLDGDYPILTKIEVSNREKYTACTYFDVGESS